MKGSVAKAIRHQCVLKGVRVGESHNPGPSRRRRTQKCVMGWDSDSELEDDHRNLVSKEVKTGHLNRSKTGFHPRSSFLPMRSFSCVPRSRQVCLRVGGQGE